MAHRHLKFLSAKLETCQCYDVGDENDISGACIFLAGRLFARVAERATAGGNR